MTDARLLWLGRALIAVGMLGVVASQVVAFAACAATTNEARVRTALDVLREVIDPAYSLATDGCIARELVAVERFEDTKDPKDEAAYHVIEQQCINTRAAFRAIRDGHARAATLLEQGKVRDAELELERVRETWRALRERKPP